MKDWEKFGVGGGYDVCPPVVVRKELRERFFGELDGTILVNYNKVRAWWYHCLLRLLLRRSRTLRSVGLPKVLLMYHASYRDNSCLPIEPSKLLASETISLACVLLSMPFKVGGSLLLRERERSGLSATSGEPLIAQTSTARSCSHSRIFFAAVCGLIVSLV